MTDRRRANSLDGRTWTRHSISVWDDIRKSKEELRLKHPALFPVELPRRLIECFLPPEGRLVLDPFCGLGSTVLAAHQLGRQGLGLDINPEYIEIARARLRAQEEGNAKGAAAQPSGCPLVLRSPQGGAGSLVVHADASSLLDYVAPGTADMAITSPPYWDILTRRRSADGKAIRHYGEEEGDLGRLADYDEFLTALGDRFSLVYQALRPGAYCVAVVMDLRKRNVFYPFHADLARELQRRGFLLDDIIIWDRRHEYNHFRPLGYPAVFRVNKAHEFLMIFQKPR
jgi:DNA modification methylase